MKYSLLLVTALLTTIGAAAQEPQSSVCEQRIKFSARTVDREDPATIPSGKALVYVLREGIGIYTVGTAADGKWVGATRKNTYFPVLLDAGEHHLCATGAIGVKSLAPGFLRIHVEEGKTYYIEQIIDSAVDARDRVRLVLLDSDQGERQVKRSKPSIMAGTDR